MGLEQALAWLSTIGAGIIVYFLLENIAALVSLPPVWKRVIAIFGTAAIAVIAFLLEVRWEFVALPLGEKAWVEALFAIMYGALSAIWNQLLHGFAKLSKE